MTLDVIDALARLDSEASPSPWFVREMDDDMCMSAVGVWTEDERFSCADAMGRSEWDGGAAVAGCLVQSTLKIVHSDARWTENAVLIASMRNNLPELLRLARLGLSFETTRGRSERD